MGSDEAVKDVSAVVNWIIGRSRESKVALVGLGAGGHWAALYAVKNSDKVSHLVLLNILYGVKAPWPMGKTVRRSPEPRCLQPRGRRLPPGRRRGPHGRMGQGRSLSRTNPNGMTPA